MAISQIVFNDTNTFVKYQCIHISLTYIFPTSLNFLYRKRSYKWSIMRTFVHRSLKKKHPWTLH